MRRLSVLLVTGLLAAGGLSSAVSATPSRAGSRRVGASAAARTAGSADRADQNAPRAKADYDGDGYVDLAISVFAYDDNGVEDAGAVSIMYGGPAGLDPTNGPGNQLFTQDSPGMPDQSETADLWGRALAAGDFNGDGFSDLAIGAGHEDIEGFGAEQGAVTVVYGGPSGLDTAAGPGAQWWTQDSPGILDQVDPQDNFGRAVYGFDFNADGFDDLAIGVAYEDVDNVPDAGAVNVIYGGPSGLAANAGPGNQFWSLDSPGIRGDAGEKDRGGWALAASDFNGDGFGDLVIGFPGKTVNGLFLAGASLVIYGSTQGLSASAGPGNQLWSQDSKNIIDQAEAGDLFGRTEVAGDFNGDGFADLVIGDPSEGVGSNEIPDAGSVAVLYGGASGLTANAGPGNQLWSQDSPGIKDQAEAHDHFGRHVGIGDFNHDGFDDLAVGVVSEDVGNIPDAGAVNVLYGTPTGLTSAGNQLWGQGQGGLQGVAEFNDAMGRAVTGLDFNADGFDDLAIGVPGDHVNTVIAAGSINVLFGSAAALTSANNQLWNMDSPNMAGDIQSGALFGSGFTGLPAGGCGAGGTCAEG